MSGVINIGPYEGIAAVMAGAIREWLESPSDQPELPPPREAAAAMRLLLELRNGVEWEARVTRKRRPPKVGAMPTSTLDLVPSRARTPKAVEAELAQHAETLRQIATGKSRAGMDRERVERLYEFFVALQGIARASAQAELEREEVPVSRIA